MWKVVGMMSKKEAQRRRKKKKDKDEKRKKKNKLKIEQKKLSKEIEKMIQENDDSD